MFDSTQSFSSRSLSLHTDTVIRRNNHSGEIEFVDASNNPKKIVAEELTLGTGTNATKLKRKGKKLVIETGDGTGGVSIGKSWTVLTSGITTNLSINSYYFVDTLSGVVNVKLPQTPEVGDFVVIADHTGGWGITSCVVAPHASATGGATYIHGSTETLEANVKFATATLTFTGISTVGWLVK